MPTATAEEQLLLELVNEARLDPLANAQRYVYSFSSSLSLSADINAALKAFGVDGHLLQNALQALQPVGALAWNDSLGSAAEAHNAAMIGADQQSHQVPGEAALSSRVQTAGYTGWRALGENVFAHSSSLLYGHAGFMIDWGEGPGGMQSPAGHRANIMSASFTEVGIDVTAEKNSATQVGPYLITEDFGSRGKFFVTGVAYSDNDLSEFYSIGEGVAGLTATWGSASATSGSAGGYSLAVPTLGAGVVTLTGGGLLGALTVTTSITDTNLKLDVVDGKTLLTSGSISVSGPVNTIKVITIKGTSVTGGAGAQQIFGNDGEDTLNGGAGDDLLFGGFGKDTLQGGDGNDQLKGEGGNDIIDGGAGLDTAVYHDAKAKYIFMANRDGSFTVSGDRDGTDRVANVEYFRFADGQFRWDAKSASLVPMANNAPTVASSQAISTNVGTTEQIVIKGSDPDGDPLTYAAGRAANGAVQSLRGGVFSYTPKIGYSGADSFAVTVSDGRGGTATQIVNITVATANQLPTVAASQSVSTTAGQAKQITVSASDADGDTLTYTAANAAHGSVTGGTNGVFTYKATAGYSGGDSFVVTVADGKGGTATHTVNVNVQGVFVPPPPSSSSSDPFSLYMANGQVDAVGGTGMVMGTNGFQDIRLLDHDDFITFDGSFNRGGDIIRLPGNANEYAILLTGTVVELRSADSNYFIPIGSTGASLVFADGVRKLYYDSATQLAKIGGQTISDVATQITAPTDNSPLPSGADGDAAGRIYLANGSDLAVSGDHSVFGTAGAEIVRYVDGDLMLDGSFNRGGDKLYLPDPISGYQAYLSGSQLVLMSSGGDVTIPIGDAGMALYFDGDAHVLRYDPVAKKVFLGDHVIVSTSADNPDEFAGGNERSLDVGAPSQTVSIDLDDGIDYVLTDNAGVNTNVHIHGFDRGDAIKVTGVSLSEYNFSNGDADKDGVYGDLVLSYTTDSVVNSIALIGMLDPSDLVYSLATAEAAFGGKFLYAGNETIPDEPDEPTEPPLGDLVSIDIGSQASPAPLNLVDGTDYVLTDNALVTSNVRITGFDLGDIIQVTGVPASEYNFGNGDADKDGTYGDLLITYSTGSASNTIAILDAFAPNAFVLSLSTAEQAMGGEFITFG